MRIKLLGAVVAALLVLAVPASAAAETLIGSGSVAAQPVLTALFHKYTKLHPSTHFVYTPNGGNAGVKDVQTGKSQFAGQARDPLPSDAGTTYIKLYLDGLCMDVNPANSLSNITIQQTSDIYHGLTTNWSNVPGSGLNSTIDPVGRDTNGGTYNFFLQVFLNNQPPASVVNPLTADGLVLNAVRQDQNAIGYFGLAWQLKGVKAVTVNGIACSPKKVKNFSYPGTRFIYLVVPTSSPNPSVLKFSDWVRRSVAAGLVIPKAGGVPAFNKKPKKHHHHH
jgi:phosphate transport system substrate-binding protein